MKRRRVTFRLLVKEMPGIRGDTATVTVDLNDREEAWHALQAACRSLFDRASDRSDKKKSLHLPFCELPPKHKGICMNFDPASRIDEEAVLWIEHEHKTNPGGRDG